jgi:hypothetical protein
MFYRPKAYPFPVLGFNLSGFLNGSRFECTINAATDTDGGITLGYEFLLENIALRDLVMGGGATLGFDVYSRQTLTRKFISVQTFIGEASLQELDLFGPVEISPLLVTIKDVPDYQPSEISQEYVSETFFVPAGSPVAIGQPLDLEVEPDHNRNAGLFTIRATLDKEDHYYELVTDSDVLVLSVSEKMYSAITSVRNSPSQKTMIWPSINQDVLETALESLKWDGEERRWARSLSRYLNNLNVDFNHNSNCQEIAARIVFEKGWGAILKDQED